MSSTDNQPGAPDGPAVDPVAQITAALAQIESVDLAALDAAGVSAALRDIEHVHRLTAAVAASLWSQVHRHDLDTVDGHHSPRSMIRHLCALSGPEAAARDRVAAALPHLPVTAAAHRGGVIGDCQARRLARTHANPRIRDLLAGAETHLVDIARTQPYKWFDDAVTAWERLADQDGTIDHATRREDARIRTLPSGMTELTVRLRSGRGAITTEIFEHYLAAETAADWDTARDQLGDHAAWDNLPRNDAERRADAFMALITDAASTPPDAREPRITIDLLIDHHEYLRQLAILTGHHPTGANSDTDDTASDTTADQPSSEPACDHLACGDPRCGDTAPGTAGHDPNSDTTSVPAPNVSAAAAGRQPRSHTANGIPVDPWDIASYTIGSDLRLVVIGADSAVIDLGRRSRCYTGSARDAVMLRHPECAWAGCHTPTRRCQADHATPHNAGGPTNATNGQPLCGHHNRHKHTHHYRVWCDPQGTWHTTRPDGTDI